MYDSEKNSLILLAYIVMLYIAGYRAGQHISHVPNGNYVVGISIFLGTAITMFPLLMLGVIPYTPLFMIPTAGLMVYNAMIVTELAMQILDDDMKLHMDMVERALAIGETPPQRVRSALIVGLLPVLNHLKTFVSVGFGVSTCLLNGGFSLMGTISAQIVVMIMLLCGSTLSSIIATNLCWPRPVDTTASN